jgi:hypothetical protein
LDQNGSSDLPPITKIEMAPPGAAAPAAAGAAVADFVSVFAVEPLEQAERSSPAEVINARPTAVRFINCSPYM